MLLLNFADLILLNGGLVLFAAISQQDFILEVSYFTERWVWFLTLSIVWRTIASAFNLYDLRRAGNPPAILRWTPIAILVTSTLYGLIPYITPPLVERRLYLPLLPLILGLLLIGWRLFYARVLVRKPFDHQILILGAGWSGKTLAETLQATIQATGNAYGYKLLGFVDDNPELQRETIGGLPVLGTRNHLVELIGLERVDELVLAISKTDDIHPELVDLLLRCREGGVEISTMTQMYESLTGRIPVQHVDMRLALAAEKSIWHPLYQIVRRLMDFTVAFIGCLLLLLVIPFIWLANQLTDPGDLFYRQTRVGKGGKRFQVIKFRSMVMNAEKKTGPIWASERDPRITPIGRFLRRSRLDELPQFWNVLRGDMALIGPRPERPLFVEQLAAKIPLYRARHAIKPGITGWAQVSYEYGASIEDARIKLEYDLYYIKNQSLLLDLRIIFRTIGVVFGLKGR